MPIRVLLLSDSLDSLINSLVVVRALLLSCLSSSSLQLYRDCLRLVRHVAPGATSAKAVALRQTVRNEFRKNAGQTDPDKITSLKANAVRALSNYLLAVSAPKDKHLQSSAKEFHGRSVQEAQAVKQKSRQEDTTAQR